MSYEDKLLDAIITTPDDIDYSFAYQDVEKDIEKKTSSYIFGEVDGQLVEDFGLGAVNLPLTIFFHGKDYDEVADAFEESASLKGVSVLQHPRYGIKNVVITRIKRRDSLKSASNQAVFVLEISETIIPEKPESGLQTRRAILAYLDSLADVNAGIFDQNFLTELAGDIMAAKNRITSFVNNVRNAVNKVLNTVKSIQDTFDNLERSIISNIDFYMSAPLILAQDLQRLISAPARLVSRVKDRIDYYKKLYNKLISGEDDPVSGQDKKNQMAEKQLLTTSLLSGMTEVYLFPEGSPDKGTYSSATGTAAANSNSTSTTSTAESTPGQIGFSTQNDAINAALELREQYLTIQDYLDNLEAASIDDPLYLRFEVSDEITALIKKITSEASKNLVRLSFSLKKERSLTLEKPYDLITLAYKLYNSTANDKLDLLINSNKLTGEELLEIPKGKEIVFYV